MRRPRQARRLSLPLLPTVVTATTAHARVMLAAPKSACWKPAHELGPPAGSDADRADARRRAHHRDPEGPRLLLLFRTASRARLATDTESMTAAVVGIAIPIPRHQEQGGRRCQYDDARRASEDESER